MRLTLAVGLAVASLLVPSAAQASDASLKSTVKKELKTLAKAEKRYRTAVKTVDSDAELGKAKTATEKLSTAVDRFHDKIQAEQADSADLKDAQDKILDASETYSKGLDKLVAAIDAKSKAKVKSALKTIAKANKKFYSAGKAFGEAGS